MTDDADDDSGNDENRKCNRPCPHKDCTGRCSKAYNHDGDHSCNKDGSHPDW
jgi:hypothetical protein